MRDFYVELIDLAHYKSGLLETVRMAWLPSLLSHGSEIMFARDGSNGLIARKVSCWPPLVRWSQPAPGGRQSSPGSWLLSSPGSFHLPQTPTVGGVCRGARVRTGGWSQRRKGKVEKGDIKGKMERPCYFEYYLRNYRSSFLDHIGGKLIWSHAWRVLILITHQALLNNLSYA